MQKIKVNGEVIELMDCCKWGVRSKILYNLNTLRDEGVDGDVVEYQRSTPHGKVNYRGHVVGYTCYQFITTKEWGEAILEAEDAKNVVYYHNTPVEPWDGIDCEDEDTEEANAQQAIEKADSIDCKNRRTDEDKMCEDSRMEQIVLAGIMNYSFGKNGLGLSYELTKLGRIIETLSKDNHVYMTDAFIDGLDDVYNLKFEIIPKKENEWMIEEEYTN